VFTLKKILNPCYLKVTFKRRNWQA